MSLKLIIWNVQHGSAAYIQTPNGKHIAIDLGASDAFSPLQFLMHSGVQQLDHVTITHPHMDHIDDILNFDCLSPRTLLTPNHLSENDIRDGNPEPDPNQEAEAKLRKYLEIRSMYNSPVDQQGDVDLAENNGGVSIRTFVPTQSSAGNLNNHSVVTLIEYSGVKILIPGDNESASWEELLSQDDFIEAIEGTQVFVASHHGRESGFHGPLFDHFHPAITLISDGPSGDTSATYLYTDVTEGWSVRRSNGMNQDRKCVTTRNDGHIRVTITPSSPIGFLDVQID